MLKVSSLHAREVLDSRGNPTVEVVASSKKLTASAIVPSGASTGTHEALELRDGDPRRYGGKGVRKAVLHVNTLINKKIAGKRFTDQRDLDSTLLELDGTENKSKLGANALLGVSLACAKLAAKARGLPFFQYLNKKAALLPVPMMNIMNGGAHADSGLEFQELMIVPAGAPNFREALRMGAEIFHALKKILSEKGLPTTVGDEGGFAPRVKSHEAALDLMVQACEKARYAPGKQVFFAIDAAASEFTAKDKKTSGEGGLYKLKIRGRKKKVSAEELVHYYAELARKYPIFSIEDGCGEDDWEGWKLLTRKLDKKLQIAGDDLFVTNPLRLATGIEHNVANAILIKLNQIGTLTETLDVIRLAKQAGYANIVSHRSGETEDTAIAHVSVGMETGQIKTGSLSRTDRVAKYNELLRIEEMLGTKAKFLGKKVLIH